MNTIKIGIDLGTTHSCCGVYKNDRVELVPYNKGTRTFASHVYYNPNTAEIVVGDAAIYNARCFDHTIYDSKRFIGKKYDDPSFKEDMKYWPFKVIRGDNNEPLVEIKYNNKTIHLTADEISSDILKKVKEATDLFMNQSPKLPTEAVITVPAYFNHQQRRNTIEAAKKANLKVIKVINEPSAAAIAYADQRIKEGSKSEETVLVYDFGGGTFDVSIVKINYERRVIKLIKTGGDCHLGGADIDQRLTEHFLNKYKEKIGKEMTAKQIFKLRKACEKAKCLLTENNTEATVECETLEDAEVDNTLTKPEFEKLVGDLLNRTIEIVDSFLKEPNLKNEDIDFLILAGGSSRIPRVQELLKEKFPTTVIYKNINPDEVVAYGACVYANNNSMRFEMQNIITHTISTDVEKDGKTVLCPLIPKNTPIPYKSKEPIKFANFEENTDHIDISVFEGEGKYPTDEGITELRCEPFIIPIRNVRARSYIIETRYKVDEYGILTVDVKDTQTGEVKTLRIELH